MISDIATGAIATVPAHLRRLDPENQSRLESLELEREWADRRMETFRLLDLQFRQAIGDVFQVATDALAAASDAQNAMERDARAIVERLEAERSRLLDEIREQQREREQSAREIAETRRRAEDEAKRIRGQAEDDAARLRHAAEEEATRVRNAAAADAARIRRQAEEERASILGDAETRRVELLNEIRMLETQMAEVAGRIGSLMSRPGPALDAGGPARASGLLAAAPEPESTARALPSDEAALGALGSRLGAQVRAEVAVSGLPSLSHAQHLLRGIQRLDGVVAARAESVEPDSLLLSVDHDPQSDFAAAVEAISDVPVQLVHRGADRLEFRFLGA